MSGSGLKLLLATSNRDKVKEYLVLLKGIPYDIETPSDAVVNPSVSETGETMEENAALKAKAYSTLSGSIALADDSGLEVDALGGEPGVLSSRYAGEEASDKERIEYLLKKMLDVPWRDRAARFRCVIAIARPNGDVSLCHGECPGVIAFEPRGGNGFGYDPIFYLPEMDRTMAELSMEEKNSVSHRGKAAVEARRLFETLRYER